MAGEPARMGILTAVPGAAPTAEAPGPGEHRLGLDGRRDAVLLVPPGLAAGAAAPLIVMLHGAGGAAGQGLDILRGEAGRIGALLLAPDSRAGTWDVIVGDYGPDVAFIDRALAWVYERFAVDPDRLAVAGFSDGASYALCLGLTNGEAFSHILAFAPGFAAPTRAVGAPRIYICHGRDDRVLPIDRCSRRLVPRLEAHGYPVTYREFDGGHTVPPERAAEALALLEARGPSPGRG